MTAGTDLDGVRAVEPDDSTPEDGDARSRWDRHRWQPPPGWWWHLDDLLGLAIVVACCVFVLVQLQPELFLRNTTPNGGDLGAHVWWPAHLRDHLLPWRLAGWSPDFYAGFPAGQFYFPVPALAIVGLDVLIPYNIAFKLVVVAGPALVPIGAYVFARGLRAPNPTPAAFAVAATALLFFTGDPGASPGAQAIAFNQRIMGGTLASTLAGEFSFTIAIAFALLFFGTLAIALRTRRHLWLPALLLALCLMSHLVVGIFLGIGALTIWAFHGPLRNFARAAAIGAVGVCLSAVWLLPLLVTMKYTTNMRYGAIGVGAPPGQGYANYLFPGYFLDPAGWEPYRWGGYVLIAIAVVAAIVHLRRSTLVVLVMTVAWGVAFRYWTELGTHVWNLRLVSFWYFGIHLLMAIGVAEVVRGAGWLGGLGWRRVAEWRVERDAVGAPVDPDPDPDGYGDYDEYAGDVTRLAMAGGNAAPGPAVAPGTAGVRAWADWLRRPPPRAVDAGERGTALVVMLVLTAVLAFGALREVDAAKGFLPYWAKWNFSGYENVVDEVTGTYSAPCANGGTLLSTLPAEDGQAPLCVFASRVAIAKQRPEYDALMSELRALAPGRSLWEGGPSLDKYGTPLALMLIPYWTDGRITTMEGVYFEASATTPYHFEAVAALVAPGQNSNPVRGIPYRDQQSFGIGVDYLQAMGIDYFIAHTLTTKAKADAEARLTKVASSPDVDGADPQGWSIYRVAGAPLVEGLAYEPVVAEGVGPGPEGWEQEIAAPWWWFPEQLDRPVVSSGPDSWRRADGAAALTTRRRAIADPVQVSRVRAGDDSISFRVDRVGEPVLVKTSWFPNWRVDGASGPYRATPNFMVVVPTEKQVTLTYGTTPAEWLGRLLTLAGLVGLGLLVWWGRRRSGADPEVPAGTMTDPSGA
ncbi:MAG: hypothetical protein ACKOA9_00365 [Actinomycetota bacterium]